MKYESHYSDEVTTIDDLKRLVKQFASERHWVTSYTPKNIALSAALEASKVIECFQGLMSEKSFELKKDPEKKQIVAEEISDVLAHLLHLALLLDVDLSSELVKKMKKDEISRPAPDMS